MLRPPADSDSKVIFPVQWHGRATTPDPELPAVQNSVKDLVPLIEKDNADPQLPALPSATDKTVLARPPLVPEGSDFLEGDAPAADKVQAFLTRALEAAGGSQDTAAALVPWICDALLSNHSVKAYGRDFMDFVRHMQAQGVTPLEVTADHVKIYKRRVIRCRFIFSRRVIRCRFIFSGKNDELPSREGAPGGLNRASGFPFPL